MTADDCCTRDNPCEENSGDCNADEECAEDLICVKNSCHFDKNLDCCQKDTSKTEGIIDYHKR